MSEEAEPAAVGLGDCGNDFSSCEMYSSTSEFSSHSGSSKSQQRSAQALRVDYSLNYRNRYFSRVFQNNKQREDSIFANKNAQTGTAC